MMEILKTYEGFSNAEIGIKDDAKDKIIDFLNRLLSNEFVLYLKLLNFHWNVIGNKFNNIHKYFEELYDEMFDFIDETAERVRQLGGKPIGTMDGFLKKTELKEYQDDKEVASNKDMYKILQEDYEFIIREIRNFLADKDVDNGTTNFLEDMISKLEKDAWMIRSHID